MNDLNSRLRAASSRRSREVLVLGLSFRQIERRRQPDARRNRFVDQRVERGGADDLQHRVALGRVRADVAGLERFERLPSVITTGLLDEVGVLRGVEQAGRFAGVGAASRRSSSSRAGSR